MSLKSNSANRRKAHLSSREGLNHTLCASHTRRSSSHGTQHQTESCPTVYGITAKEHRKIVITGPSSRSFGEGKWNFGLVGATWELRQLPNYKLCRSASDISTPRDLSRLPNRLTSLTSRTPVDLQDVKVCGRGRGKTRVLTLSIIQ